MGSVIRGLQMEGILVSLKLDFKGKTAYRIQWIQIYQYIIQSHTLYIMNLLFYSLFSKYINVKQIFKRKHIKLLIYLPTLPMLNKYGNFRYAICTFQGVTSHQ